jgi:hypothetical protein
MLPEVWVRVSGLPSDIRTDYLSLWGVGTLFGKTLDIDMAYNRKNKELRIKIGCLDHRLIPADSDMFIRRGFFKLRFEVELEEKSNEVNMMDANNGSDGNDGANQDDEKHEGGHDMETDKKGNDMEDLSKNDDQEDSHMHNGVEGMQEQLCNLDAIQIGTLHVKLAPTGICSDVKNLNQYDYLCNAISHDVFVPQNDEVRATFDVDMMQKECFPGSDATGDCQAAIGQQLATVPSGSVAACPVQLLATNGVAPQQFGR